MKKKILSVILASVMCLTSLVTAEALTGSPVVSISAEAASYKTGTYKVTHSNGVNVRKNAGTRYSIVGAAAKGTTFKVIKTKSASGYIWGYTLSIKCTNGVRSGWVALKNCAYQDPNAKSNEKAEITFTDMSFPSTLTKGKSQNISGKITSTTNIDSIRAYVADDKGNIALDYTVYPNKKSYTLKNSPLDYSLPFGTLDLGNYTLNYDVKSGSSQRGFTHLGITVIPEINYEDVTVITPDAVAAESETSLDLEASLAYAAKYWDRKDSSYSGWNKDYWKGYGSSDCANFVSQILVAGGLETDKTWKKGSSAFLVIDDLEKYLSKTHNVKCYLNSKAYNDCRVQDYVVKKSEIKASDIKAGDIIVTTGSGYDYNGHVMFVSKVKNGKIYAYGHTSDRNGAVFTVAIGGTWGIQGVIKTSELYN